MRALLPLIAAATLPVLASACGSTNGAAHVEVVAAVRHVAPGEAWDLEAASYRATFHELLQQNGDRLVVTPLSDRSLSETPIFNLIAPTESFVGSNHDDAEHDRSKDEAEAAISLKTLAARRAGSKRTEIIDALVGAHERFDADDEHVVRLLLVISTGFEQSSIVNMADYGLKLNAPTIRRRLIAHLKATGQVVDLRGIRVCMLGITGGEGGWDYNRRKGVRLFWEDYFRAAGAVLEGYGPTAASCRPLASAAETR